MKIQIIRWLMLFLALLIAAAIFFFSAEDGEKSGNLSDKLAEKILQIFGGSNADTPGEGQEDVIVSVGSVFRKIAHFIEYFALGAALCGFFSTFSMKVHWRGLGAFGISVLYAVSDELHQYFIPGRHASPLDVLLDGAGAACGILAVLGVVAWIQKKRKDTVHIEKRSLS